MYIENKYWDNWIGGTDDSLTLVDYLDAKGKEEISLGEIFADTGLDALEWDFRRTEPGLEWEELEFHYAIDLVTSLAALLLECKVSGSVALGELSINQYRTERVRITATPEEHKRLNRALHEFVAAPLDYDLLEMCPEEDMLEMARLCGELTRELYPARVW